MADRGRPTREQGDADEGFLRRWSRRKVEARSPAPAPAEAASDAAEPALASPEQTLASPEQTPEPGRGRQRRSIPRTCPTSKAWTRAPTSRCSCDRAYPSTCAPSPCASCGGPIRSSPSSTEWWNTARTTPSSRGPRASSRPPTGSVADLWTSSRSSRRPTPNPRRRKDRQPGQSRNPDRRASPPRPLSRRRPNQPRREKLAHHSKDPRNRPSDAAASQQGAEVQLRLCVSCSAFNQHRSKLAILQSCAIRTDHLPR